MLSEARARPGLDQPRGGLIEARSRMGGVRGPRIGLLGGSFNPPHQGHRHISLMALRVLRLDAVWWLVTPQNPLKSAADNAPFEKRLAQARSVAHHPKIIVTDIEARLGTHFTVDTLKRMKKRHPAHRFVWLMGADNLAGFNRWRAWKTIARTMPIAVMDRPGEAREALTSLAAQRFAYFRVDDSDAPLLADLKPPHWAFVTGKLNPASSTEIRARGNWP